MADSNQSDAIKAAGDNSARETISAALNYFKWLAAEEGPIAQGLPLTSESALQWFCPTLQDPLLDVLKARYANLKGSDTGLAIFPVEEVLSEKVRIPLHQAKVAYVLGHELGCIALSGMVGEMLALLRFNVSRFGSGPDALTESRQERLFGRNLERLEHSRRVGTLELLGLIDTATADKFTSLSRIRNKYLHRLSAPHGELAKDAQQAYEIAVQLAVKILGLGIKGHGATVDPEVLAYIRAREQISDDGDDKGVD